MNYVVNFFFYNFKNNFFPENKNPQILDLYVFVRKYNKFYLKNVNRTQSRRKDIDTSETFNSRYICYIVVTWQFCNCNFCSCSLYGEFVSFVG